MIKAQVFIDKPEDVLQTYPARMPLRFALRDEGRTAMATRLKMPPAALPGAKLLPNFMRWV